MVRLLQYNVLQPHIYFSLRPVVPALVADSGVHQFWLGTRFHEFQVAETIVYFNVVFVIEFLHVLIHPCPTATNQFDCCKTCLPLDKDIPHLIRPPGVEREKLDTIRLGRKSKTSKPTTSQRHNHQGPEESSRVRTSNLFWFFAVVLTNEHKLLSFPYQWVWLRMVPNVCLSQVERITSQHGIIW